jgi:NAD(P)-dependent dehydrogenase (short-subunit alcohol dehydrogenase family)
MTDAWTLADAPNLEGRIAIVTGATGGLGYQTALGLCRLGADTVLAARNADKGALAVQNILAEVPRARVRFACLDLDSLASVSDFAAAQPAKIDILVNNAAVMGLQRRAVTRDGFERQIGVNYLGHYALSLHLLNALKNGGRIVNVASVAHRRAALNLGDFQSERSYGPMRAYGQSKLAMLIFSIELQRQADRLGWNLKSIAAHPGWARTDIIPNGIGGGAPGLKARIAALGFNLFAQSAADGALPILFAAAAPEARGGAYYGPAGRGEIRGKPGPARIFPQAADAEAGRQLWALSQSLTGVSAPNSRENIETDLQQSYPPPAASR